MSANWMRVPLACWPENFSILCAAVNVKAWLLPTFQPHPPSPIPSRMAYGHNFTI